MKRIVLAVCGLALAGCSQGGSGGKTVRVALVVKALDSEFWQRMRVGAEAAAATHKGVEVAVLAPEREINIDQQVSILEDQILKRVSALAVAPAGASEVTPMLEKARAAGIPVLVVDTDVPWPGKLSYIGTDNRLGGRLAGEFMARALGGKGQVAVIRGVLGVATHEDRLSGFREAIAAAPGIKCVAVQPANSERAVGMSVMENLLTAHPHLAAVFATNDQMALGAMEAVSARNRTGKIVLVGFDATREAARAVQAGQLAAVIAQHPEIMGRRAVEEAVKAARGEAVERRVDTGTTLVTRDNAAQYLR